jgi:predicted phosphoadenosine phosphosulfate sulfurtransferase
MHEGRNDPAVVGRARRADRRNLGISVVEAAEQRVAWTFDTFPRVYLSGPSGKDSTVMMHIAAREARRRGRKLGVLYLDLEAQYLATIDCVREMFAEYADVIEPYWLALPLNLRNAVSTAHPFWTCWDPERREDWVRPMPTEAIGDGSRFPFFRPGMEFEEFVAEFGHWYGAGKATACLVGIRTAESLNRWRAIAQRRNSRFDGRPWTSWKGRAVYNVYPIYDWRTEDIWTYTSREGCIYNRIYDQMHLAGLSPHQMRICQPYGDDQRKGLWLYHVLEPDTWSRVVNRVYGANSGALYARERGNVLGNGKVSLPEGHTWQSYARFLLDSLPDAEREHYETKIDIFLHWWSNKGIPVADEADSKLEAARKAPSWRRICKVILKNDRICKGLSFSQQSSTAFDKYKRAMRERRLKWRLEQG